MHDTVNISENCKYLILHNHQLPYSPFPITQLQCKHGVDIVEHIKAENICQDLYMETIPEGIELCEVVTTN